MRISDWSSDVCSSDLDIARRGEGIFEADVLRIGAPRILGPIGARFDRAVVDPVIGLPAVFERRELDEELEGRAGLAPRLRRAVAGRGGIILEIGSAACRERGCMYVCISVSAGKLKKN